MKQSFRLLMCFFLGFVLCSKDPVALERVFSVGAQGGTLYADASSFSAWWQGEAGGSVLLKNNPAAIGVDALYTGAFSNTDFLSGQIHIPKLDLSFDFGRWNFTTGISAYFIPDELVLVINSQNYRQWDTKGALGTASLTAGWNFWSLGLSGFAGGQDSAGGSLYFLDGKISSPCFGGIFLNASFPRDYFFSAGIAGAELELYDNQNVNQIGKGDLLFCTVHASKNWNLFGTEEEKVHEFRLSGGYTYAGGFGRASTNADEQAYTFFPFIYILGKAYADLHFLDASFRYGYKKGPLTIDTSLFYLLNLYTDAWVYYKYTFKDSLIYDGSSKTATEQKTFSNGDSLLCLQAGCRWTFATEKNGRVTVSAQKIIPVPIISDKTFSRNGEQDGLTAARIIQMVLLSGISAGVHWRM